ncbi:4Fe-4S dicluster domain-containing protein [Merdimonas faecis]|uniref:4Fe-4S binding protein n=1 Tax=Merdimonas faecis TaxID=1653435 RepID=A0A9D3AIT1_9FIRM|nr:4Fe-4S binding protein [Merdimonas faecis]HJH48961.1 4Fe-4S binding protein [Merdimonas faecis]
MIRKIIQINEEKCNGCGACAAACHEGAIQMINGKAKLIRDDYCDGLGDCLPACPTGAITFEEREAAAYDPEAVQLHLKTRKDSSSQAQPAFSGCPGQAPRSISHTPSDCSAAKTPLESAAPQSQLSQWPVQIQLAPVNAPYFQGAHLLIAADCTAYAYADFHQRFIRNHITLIGCPKLDLVDYTEKLTEIIRGNDIKSLTIVRMEVPCCGGIQHAATQALKASGKFIPWQVVTVKIDGTILESNG